MNIEQHIINALKEQKRYKCGTVIEKYQGMHHKKMSFQDESRKMLESYGVDYNKEYVFKD